MSATAPTSRLTGGVFEVLPMAGAVDQWQIRWWRDGRLLDATRGMPRERAERLAHFRVTFLPGYRVVCR